MPPLPSCLLFICLVGSIYHYHTRLENQEVKVEILESGGKVHNVQFKRKRFRGSPHLIEDHLFESWLRNNINISPLTVSRLHKYHVKSPKYLFGNPQKNLLNFTNQFSQYLDKFSPRLLLFLIIWFWTGIAVVGGIGEEDSSTSMLPASAFLKNYYFSVFGQCSTL